MSAPRPNPNLHPVDIHFDDAGSIAAASATARICALRQRFRRRRFNDAWHKQRRLGLNAQPLAATAVATRKAAEATIRADVRPRKPNPSPSNSPRRSASWRLRLATAPPRACEHLKPPNRLRVSIMLSVHSKPNGPNQTADSQNRHRRERWDQNTAYRRSKAASGTRRATPTSADAQGSQASVQYRDRAPPLLKVSRRVFPFIARVFADAAYVAKRRRHCHIDCG